MCDTRLFLISSVDKLRRNLEQLVFLFRTLRRCEALRVLVVVLLGDKQTIRN
jgi:hypothetical protein